jgi:two-component system nitrate/nitrite response regulator NarL
MGEVLEIVLADDHAVFLDALTAVLGQLGHLILGSATTRSGMVDAVRASRPDICITENRFPDGEGVEVLGQLAQASPDTKVIMLTADGSPETLRQALDAGASAYVHKTRGVAVLLEVLRRVTAGEIVIEGSFVRARPVPEAQAPLQLRRLATYLTQRELECLSLLAAGLDTAAMSHRLGVSRTTVRSHVQAVLTKLGVHSRLEAASVATRYGLVDLSAHRDLPATARA